MDLFLLVACALLFAVILIQTNTIQKLQQKIDEKTVFSDEKPVYIGLETTKTAKKPAKKAAKKPVRKTTKRS